MSSHHAHKSTKVFPVPDLGEGLEDVTIVEWDVEIGQTVELNQVLCIVETAKAQVEIPSPHTGIITKLGGKVGDLLAVGEPLIHIDTESTDGEDNVDDDVLPSQSSKSTRTHGRHSLEELRSHAQLPVIHEEFSRPRAQPKARKLAAELGIDLATLPYSPNEIITTDDVMCAADQTTENYQVVQFDSLHNTMAHVMEMSRTKIPDAHASVHIDATHLLTLREQLIAGGVPPHQVSTFILLTRLTVLALEKNPIFNSTWVNTSQGEQLRTHHSIHLGFGVATPRGLVVPVIHDAHQKTTQQLGESIAELIDMAREGTLKPTQLQGSTFTISNFGALGLDEGVPVIHYPEVAILGIGSLKPRPIVINNTLEIRPQVTLTCVFDHRVADGAQVACFLGQLRTWIENPHTLLWDL